LESEDQRDITDEYPSLILKGEETAPLTTEDILKLETNVVYSYPANVLVKAMKLGTGISFSIIDDIPFFELANAKPSSLPLATEQRLEELKQLPEGWDGRGAHQVSDRAITKAKLILQRASTIIGFGFLKESFISPCTDGGLEIESDLASGKELFLDIAPTGESITFLLVETTPEGEEKEKEGEIQEIEDLDKLLRRASN